MAVDWMLNHLYLTAHDMCDQLHRLISLLAEYIEKCREISVEATQEMKLVQDTSVEECRAAGIVHETA
eukprot:m.24715 g.24715  ORF g.24715 m.24715 type:complete len:68 (-) comp11547_c0_seq5:39-242(-)